MEMVPGAGPALGGDVGLSAGSCGQGAVWCPHPGTAAAVGLGSRVSTSRGGTGVFGANTAASCGLGVQD